MSASLFRNQEFNLGAMDKAIEMFQQRGMINTWLKDSHLEFRPEFDQKGILQRSAWDLYNEAVRHRYPPSQADAKVISEEALTYFESKLKPVLRRKAVSEVAIPTKFVGPGVRHVDGGTLNDVPGPRTTLTFDGGTNNNATYEDTTHKLIGFDYDIYLDKITLDAGNNPQGKQVVFTPNPQQNQINVFSEAMVEAVEWFKWIGYDAPGLNMDSMTGYKGIVNTSGIIDPGALGLGADDNVADAGDIYDGVTLMAQSLGDQLFEPPYDLFMTPRVIMRAMRSVDSSRRKSDLQMLLELKDHEGTQMFSSIKWCPFLINSATETRTDGAIALIKSRPEENYIAASYPIGIYPKNTDGFGWAVKILWYGGSVIDRPEAICFANSLTTSNS